MAYELVIILALVLVNGIFAGAEIAIVGIDKMRMRHLLEQGSRGARAVQKLRRGPERFFATVQIGITIVGASAAAFGGATFAEHLEPVVAELPYVGRHAGPISVALVVIVISYLSLVLGELVPKSLAMRYREQYATFVAPALLWLSAATKPLVWLLTASSNVVLSIFRDKTSFTESRMSAEELKDLVGEATEAGALPTAVGEIASRALELVDLNVRRVMIPRKRIVAIPRNAEDSLVKQVVLEHAFSRLPVYDEDLDHISGYVLVKDLLAVAWQGRLFCLADLIRPPLFVSELTNASSVLQEMREKKVHLAIVVDEHGGTAGIVTLEDLLEELVGDISSELSSDTTLGTAFPDGSFRARGDAPVRDLERELGFDLTNSDTSTTVGGLCLALFGRMPKADESVTTDTGAKLQVVRATEREVLELRIWPPPPPPEPARETEV